MNDSRIRIVVLDDDPTGIQTVHGCFLLTEPDADLLRTALADQQPFFYILTNTRAYSQEKARQTVARAVAHVLKANESFGYPLIFVSRSDSTLRNHFPAEVERIVNCLETQARQPVDAIFLVPAFIECGRVTAGNTHYLLEGSRRVAVSETEFARDSVFGYRTAVLPEYIEEKTHGAVRAADVRSIPLDWLRPAAQSKVQGPKSKANNTPEPADERQLEQFLHKLANRAYVVVNAETYSDLNCFARAALRQVAAGKRFVFQSAGSLVKALAGIPDQPFLTKEIVRSTGPGLFVVGSHVGKTTSQLNRLLGSRRVEGVEVNVAEILSASSIPGLGVPPSGGSGAVPPEGGTPNEVLESALRNAESLRQALLKQLAEIWRQGRAPVVFTSRSELQFHSKEERLQAGETISQFLASSVRALPFAPSYLVSKGGITSHDILVRGLEVRQARVLGQLLPGVPVIRTPDDSPFPGIPYVIFPGNVGDENALVRVLEILA